jgi:hypothetical protein
MDNILHPELRDRMVLLRGKYLITLLGVLSFACSSL